MGGAEEAGAGACADQEDKGAEHHGIRRLSGSRMDD